MPNVEVRAEGEGEGVGSEGRVMGLRVVGDGVPESVWGTGRRRPRRDAAAEAAADMGWYDASVVVGIGGGGEGGGLCWYVVFVA